MSHEGEQLCRYKHCCFCFNRNKSDGLDLFIEKNINVFILGIKLKKNRAQI